MKFKNLFIYTSLSISSMFNAQNTGINTDTPRQTLDIEGTLGISQPGDANAPLTKIYDNVSLLHWNTTEPNQGKLVSMVDDDNFKPFKRIRYELKVDSNNEDWINHIDLNIDPAKYTVFIMNYRLSKFHDFNIGDGDETHWDNVYIPVLSYPDGVRNNRTPGTEYDRRVGIAYLSDHATAYKGAPIDGMTGSKRNWLWGRWGTVTPKVYVHKDDNKWKLYADYQSLAPQDFKFRNYIFEHKRVVNTDENPMNRTSKYIWRIDLLVVENNYIYDFGEIKVAATKPDKQDSRFDDAEKAKVKAVLGHISNF